MSWAQPEKVASRHSPDVIPQASELRVALVAQSLSVGGAEWQTCLSALSLQQLGVDVRIVTYHPGCDYDDFLRRHGLVHVCVSAAGHGHWSRIRAVARLFREQRVQLAHCFSASASLIALAAGRLAGTRRVFAGYRSLLQPPRSYARAHRGLTLGCGYWIVNSQCVKGTVVQHYRESPDRIEVVPNAFQEERVRTALTVAQARASLGLDANGYPVVTIIANLRPEKNLPMFLRVARRVLDSLPEARFLVAGEGPERASIEQLAVDLKVERSVRFLGRHSDVATLLRATDVFCLTSVSEGLPNALIEAGAAGVACVSTSNGGASDVIEEGSTGFMVPVNDDRAMAQRIARLLAEPSLRAALGAAAARRCVDRFSVGSHGAKLLATYVRGLGC